MHLATVSTWSPILFPTLASKWEDRYAAPRPGALLLLCSEWASLQAIALHGYPFLDIWISSSGYPMMAYHIKDPELVLLIRDLARRRKKSMIDVIRAACQEALNREKCKQPFLKRVEPVRLKVQALLDSASKSSGEAS
jgi:hypothetical protein